MLNAVLFKSKERFSCFEKVLKEYSVNCIILDFGSHEWIGYDYGNIDIIVYYPSFTFSSNYPLALHEVHENLMHIKSTNPHLKMYPDPQIVGYYNDKFKQYLFLRARNFPIPETYRSCTATTFGERIGRKGRLLSTYAPPALRHVPMHDDPEFETRTYGDATAKRRYLLKLSEGDLLVFYAGLKPFNHDNQDYPEALYFVGYFTIDQVIDFNWLSASERAAYRQRYPSNAHVKRGYAFENLVIVVGSKNSRLLNRALLISEKKPDKSGRPTFALSSEMEELLQISGFIQRSIPPRFVTLEHSVAQLAQLLDSS